MNKNLEEIKNLLNNTTCFDCEDFGLCEYCSLKQVLVDLNSVIESFAIVLDKYPRLKLMALKKDKTVANGITALQQIQDQNSFENLRQVTDKELEAYYLVKRYPEELGMVLQCNNYAEYKQTFYDIDYDDEDIPLSEESFELIKDHFRPSRGK